ncbi:OmcA/MtrC family decaheme c-type cytochrome [Geomonas subterranea]|uniref:OmcA/MtrC family decaheme c-type cytochrome n=1 Tax=Geomonas subterranea TaxID=2847989 RepID=A0ABX8LAY9_9BACT|nr:MULTISPECIES: OmcA/MtrC family decaheme c-type cytochrome [Geomonas]QXE89152.1 OmcA/MtrC family decaheme c-type cytochrome [Geomonas subterranea]QXM08731.1 OmcA/MtrC family decaheme c-type cytochrome [Geomonas subterranea]
MIGRNLRYLVALLVCVLLPLAGCSGGGSSTKRTEKGTEVTVSGKVDVAKAAAKSVFLSSTSAGALNNVFVYNALDGAQLGTAAIGTDGSFSNLTFNLPATKTILVFKAVVAQGTFRTVVPIDLSNPPAAGAVTGSNPISIVISQDSTNRTILESQLLGLTGILGDANQTLASVSKTYTDAASLWVNNGGQALAYSTNGLALSGKFSSAALLPAQDANTLGAEDLDNTTLDGSISSVSIPGSKPIVSFTVINKDTGKGIRGLKAFNLVIAQLQPGTSGSPDQWLSYMVTATSRPTTDTGYTVIDNGDGSYTVIFGKDIKAGTGGMVTYNANLTHRLMVGVRSTPSIAQLNDGSTLSNFYNEKYFVATFVPATPDVAPTVVKDMITTAACNECHGKIGVTTPHGGRGDARYCLMCHTSQRAIGRTNVASTSGAFPAITTDASGAITSASTYIADGEVAGEFVTMIHKIHMGNKLTKTNYNYAGVLFNEVILPKDVRNCRQCHKGDNADQLALAPQANNWKTKPSRKACGACHDGVNFATGAGHAAGAQASDANCVGCHADADLLHQTEIATPNNPNTPAGLTNFYYEVASATVDAVTNNLSIKFRIQKNTGSLTAAKTNVVFDGNSTNPLVGYTGGPSFLLAYFKDTANQPASLYSGDYNNLGVKAAQPKSVSIASLVGGTTGTLGTPDSSGYYTVTVNSASAFPVGATMRAVGLQGYFTQAAGTGGIAANTARHALSSVKTVTGDTVRRVVIDSAKCANCHEWFEGHGGNRVIGKDTVGEAICALCHVPNLSTSGRGAQQSLIQFIVANPVGTSLAAVTNFLTGSAFTGTISQESKDAMTELVAALGNDPTQYPEASNNFKDMVHGIHAGNNSLVVGIPLAFVRDRGTSGDFDFNFEEVTFPGVLKDCRACHKDTLTSSGAVDASKATYTRIGDKVQPSTWQTTTGVALTLQTAAGVGNNVTQVDADRKSLPNLQDKVNSPFTATCRACHSRPNALAHFATMGGQVNVNRSAVNPAGEACITCHGTTGPNAIWNAHRFSVVGDD